MCWWTHLLLLSQSLILRDGWFYLAALLVFLLRNYPNSLYGGRAMLQHEWPGSTRVTSVTNRRETLALCEVTRGPIPILNSNPPFQSSQSSLPLQPLNSLSPNKRPATQLERLRCFGRPQAAIAYIWWCVSFTSEYHKKWICNYVWNYKLQMFDNRTNVFRVRLHGWHFGCCAICRKFRNNSLWSTDCCSAYLCGFWNIRLRINPNVRQS